MAVTPISGASAEVYVVLEYRTGESTGTGTAVDPVATQVLGVFGSAAEAVRWVQKSFDETAGARRQFTEAEKLALFNLLVTSDPFIENAYRPLFIPLLPGRAMQILAGRMLGSLLERLSSSLPI